MVVDDGRDIAELVQEILLDESFTVECLYDPTFAGLQTVVEKRPPACVILDGGGAVSYAGSWAIAGWLSSRQTPIPTVMLTAHSDAREEAMLNESERARAAKVVNALPKPFDIDKLADAVWHAVGRKPAVSRASDRERVQELHERLRVAGAEDLQASRTGRQWVDIQARRREAADEDLPTA